MHATLTALLLVSALTLNACQEPSSSAQSQALKAPLASDESAEGAPQSAANEPTHVEKALRMTKRPFKTLNAQVADAQLEAILASSYEAFETSEEPLVRVFVFHYDAQELVKPAKVARWINESGLIHNGQTSANRLRVIVAGTPEAGPTDAHCVEGEDKGSKSAHATKSECEAAGHRWQEGAMAAINDFMDAFMVMR